jgi:transposase
MPMPDTFSPLEVITGVAHRRRFTTEQKLSVVAETMQPGMSTSYIARRHGLAPALLFRWRRLMTDGRREAVRVDEVMPAAETARGARPRARASTHRKTLEVRILKLELEVEILKETLACTRVISIVHDDD